MNSSFTFVDLFSGIGGFRLPLESLGGKCLGFAEIDKKAIETYKQNFNCTGELELGSVESINGINPKPDLIVGGVPCQSWSVAGKGRGFDDPRGKLWFDTIRIINLNKPKAFLLENVKGLSDPRNRQELNLIIQELQAAGYKVHYQVLNSYDYGLPQNRERIFIVGLHQDLQKTFTFPMPTKQESRLFEILDGVEETKITKSKLSSKDLFEDGKIPLSRNRFQKPDELNDFFILSDTRNGHSTIHSWDILETTSREKQICLTVLRNRRKKQYGLSDGNPISYEDLSVLIPNLEHQELVKLQNQGILRYIPAKGFDFKNSKNSSGIDGIYRIYLPNSQIFSTLTATGTRDCVALINVTGNSPAQFKQNFIEQIVRKNLYRPVKPREAARLQGFPEYFILHPNESTAKKQLGNAVSVPVIEAIVQNILSVITYEPSVLTQTANHNHLQNEVKTAFRSSCLNFLKTCTT